MTTYRDTRPVIAAQVLTAPAAVDSPPPADVVDVLAGFGAELAPDPEAVDPSTIDHPAWLLTVPTVPQVGQWRVFPGDWIVYTPHGLFVCVDEEFKRVFEAVTPDGSD